MSWKTSVAYRKVLYWCWITWTISKNKLTHTASTDHTERGRQGQTDRDRPGNSGMGLSSSASASVFSSVDPPKGSSSFTPFLSFSPSFCRLALSTLPTREKKTVYETGVMKLLIDALLVSLNEETPHLFILLWCSTTNTTDRTRHFSPHTKTNTHALFRLLKELKSEGNVWCKTISVWRSLRLVLMLYNKNPFQQQARQFIYIHDDSAIRQLMNQNENRWENYIWRVGNPSKITNMCNNNHDEQQEDQGIMDPDLCAVLPTPMVIGQLLWSLGNSDSTEIWNQARAEALSTQRSCSRTWLRPPLQSNMNTIPFVFSGDVSYLFSSSSVSMPDSSSVGDRRITLLHQKNITYIRSIPSY